MKTINRRSFCAGAAILGGSFALAGCSGTASKQADEEKPKGEIIETDIAVIGSGLAGEACALAAAQNGAKVVLVEKSPTLGSSFPRRPTPWMSSSLVSKRQPRPAKSMRPTPITIA